MEGGGRGGKELSVSAVKNRCTMLACLGTTLNNKYKNGVHKLHFLQGDLYTFFLSPMWSYCISYSHTSVLEWSQMKTNQWIKYEEKN